MADFKNTKEGRNVALKYADILHLSRPEPPVKHPRMALSNRAKIFSPFAALRGFYDEISSEGASKLLVKKVELSDEEKNDLSDKLLQVKKGMKVVVRYFVRSTENAGKYISLTGTVVMIDPVYRKLKVMQDSDRKAVGIEKELPVIVSFDDIADLAGEGITSIEHYLAVRARGVVAADGAIAFYRNGRTPDVQATAGVVAFIPGDRAVLHIEAAVTVHTHTAAAENARLNFVIADRAAVHGKVAQSSLTATPRFIIFHPHATAAFCATSCARVVADLAAVHGERAAAYDHAAIVAADFAAVHFKYGIVYYINAFSTVKAAIIFFAVGNNALPLPAAVAVAEDKCSIDIDCIATCFSRKRMAVQTEVKGLAFGNYGVGPLI